MATSTSYVKLQELANEVLVSESEGDIPWDEVNEACSFADAQLARELYPDAQVRADLGEQWPPIRLLKDNPKTWLVGRKKRAPEVVEAPESTETAAVGTAPHPDAVVLD